jgi:hypothetical protein
VPGPAWLGACVRGCVCVDSTKVQANKGGGGGGGVERKIVNYVEPSVKKKVNNNVSLPS